MNSEKTRYAFDLAASIATALGAVAVAAAVGVNWLRAAPRNQRPEPVAVYGQELPLSEHVRGAPQADVAIIEFSDFQCPYCGRFARDIFPDVVRTLVDSGKAIYDFRSFPLENLHGLAFGASKAAECAARQGGFWPMHNRLFTAQQQLTAKDLLAHASALQLEAPRFQSCLDTITPRIQADLSDGQRLGVTATPSFMIAINQHNNSVKVLYRLTGLQTLEQLTHAVESAAGRT